MTAPWLVIDVNFLCHRAFHSMGEMSHNEVKTGVIYGVLKDIHSLQERFMTRKLALCFDSKHSHRKNVFPEYKAKRKKQQEELTKEEQLAKKEFYRQVKMLRKDYLPRMGYKNVFVQKGYESDDMMAQFCQDLPAGDTAIIVTADQDLYQCIRDGVSMWSPNKMELMTKARFLKKFGIPASRWAELKSLTGCSTDGVPGVPRIGEATAIKFLKGELKPESVASKNIKGVSGEMQRKFARKLTKLPYEHPHPKSLQVSRNHELSPKGWTSVMKELGISSIPAPMSFE